ncbi:MAG: hypothetical protein PHN82_04640 [bacterium]|nr:hypothetical protein [bacterium]
MKMFGVLLCAVALCAAGAHAQDGYSVLHHFGDPLVPTDGQFPISTLVSDGSALYGTTFLGGANYPAYYGGTVFSIAPDGSNYTTLHDFGASATDGEIPRSGVLLDGGKLYGTTRSGGANNLGTVYSMNPDGSGYTILHSFGGPPGDGEDPWGGLISDGSTLYGMTLFGGANDSGVVFSVAKNGTNYTILHNFGGVANDGENPFGALFSDGTKLYGTTSYGGTEYYGTVFSMNPDGTAYNILHHFEGFASLPYDGRFPVASLVSDGTKLYGMTYFGGKYQTAEAGYNYTPIGVSYLYGGYGLGTVYTMNPDGSDYSVIHNFGGVYRDGVSPSGDLLLHDGTLYGMTTWSLATSATAAGTIFSIQPDGSDYTKLHAFAPVSTGSGTFAMADGAMPMGSLSSDGTALYGTASTTGKYGYGVIFSQALPPVPCVRVEVSSETPKGGDILTVDVTIDPIAQPFDAWGVVISQDGLIFSFDLFDPSGLHVGARPLITGVPSLPIQVSTRLYQTQLFLPAALGTWEIIVGLVPAGTHPLGTGDAIPCYLDQVTVTVTP